MGLGFKQPKVGTVSGSSMSAYIARWVPEATARNRAREGAVQPKGTPSCPTGWA